MDLTLLRDLRLDPAAPFRQGRACKACGGFSPPFDSVDFHKVCSRVAPFAYGFTGQHVQYHRCADCGFAFTSDMDGWSREDFARFVYNSDYVLTDGDYESVRPAQMAKEVAGRLGPWRTLRILDYGSGSGAFAAAMQALGLLVESYDPFSHPKRPEGHFDLITCFEVIEHSPVPVETIAEMASFLAEGGAILFSQPLQPANIEEVRGSWWYIAPRNGHVSIYTADALAVLAAGCGLTFYRGDGISAFAGPSPGPAALHLLAGVGPAHAFLRLAAPGEAAGLGGTPDGAWHELERAGSRSCRWTARKRVTWHGLLPSVSPLTVRVVVPFLNQVVEGFAGRCVLELGAQMVPLRQETGRLVAELNVPGHVAGEVTLLTPEPGIPRDLRDSPDTRSLGLALPVYPWVPPG